MSTPLLQLERVSFGYGDLSVIDDISLDIGRAQFISIVGPSGAGKSTIFKLLTGADRPDRGRILYDGQGLEEATRPFAYMPQRDALMPWRRIIDNTTLGLEVQGMSRREARSRVEPLFEEFGLAGFERHYPASLSGGMRQRAALLRTVVQGRSILLFDEPFGALDALTRSRMQLWLEGMWLKHRWTVILVTHDVREAVMLSDRIYVLSPRPATVADVIDVPLPRPRLRDAASRARAAAIEGAILDTLFSPQSDYPQRPNLMGGATS
jgi:ABC-type nitrate/sulfonate/bicarbonate transport system ATPase subunit